MMDLDPEARRVLELAREARTPSIEDKERVARRLAAGSGCRSIAGAAGAAAQGAGRGEVGRYRSVAEVVDRGRRDRRRELGRVRGAVERVARRCRR